MPNRLGYPWPPLVLAASLAACALDPPQVEDSASPEAEDEWSVQPQWTGGEAVESVESSLLLGFPDPLSLLSPYQDMMAAGDESCPGDDSQLMVSNVPSKGCISENGYFYSGVAAYTETDSSGSIGALWSFHLNAGFLLIDDLGLQYEAGGNLFYTMERTEDDSEQHWSAQIEGSWVYDGGEAWLSEGISASLSMGGSRVDDEQRNLIRGSLGLAGSWFALEELSWDASCGEQPLGRLGIRDPSGLWIWIELDPDCSGCGTGTWDYTGETEELCVDLSPIEGVLQSMAESDPWS